MLQLSTSHDSSLLGQVHARLSSDVLDTSPEQLPSPTLRSGLCSSQSEAALSGCAFDSSTAGSEAVASLGLDEVPDDVSEEIKEVCAVND